MKVLMLSDVYFPRINGVSTSIQTFRRGLAELGVEVGLIAPDYGGDYGPNHGGPAAGDDEGWVRRVPARRVPFDPEDRLPSRRAMRLSGEAFNPGLIHVQTPFAAQSVGVDLGRRLRVPVIATYHTLFEEYLHHYVPLLPRAFSRSLARGVSRRQCNALDAVVVPSSAMAARLRDYGVTVPLYVAPTGIPLAAFEGGDGAAFRARHEIAPTARVALFVGRVAHEKNIDFLLRVARGCREALPDLIWVIAGEGPALAGLRELAVELGIEQRVRFVGYLDRARELPGCYAAADVFTFASRTETQGLVLLEAMAAGLPVVALSAMGTRDIVEPGLGAVAPRDDLGEFASALSLLLNDEGRRRVMRLQARQFCERWSDQGAAERLNDIYRQVRFERLRRMVSGSAFVAA